MANDQDLKRKEGIFGTGEDAQSGADEMSKSISDNESTYGGDDDMGQTGSEDTDEMVDSGDE